MFWSFEEGRSLFDTDEGYVVNLFDVQLVKMLIWLVFV